MPAVALWMLAVAAAPSAGAAVFQPGTGARITCDLGEVTTVTRVTLMPRPLAHGYCARDFQVLLSRDGERWTSVATFAKPTGQQPDTFTFAPAEARYVRLWIATSWETAPGSNNVQIAEVEVYGPDGGNLARAGRVTADSEEARHPAGHANDGDPQTFWVSGGEVVNQSMWEPRPADVWPRDASRESRLLPELFAHFRDPANTYRPKAVWFFNDMPDDASSTRQLEEMKRARLGGPSLFAYRGLPVDAYLSEGWLASTEHIARECARLGLDMWILDEGCYPSGFADGRVTDEHPELRSKALRVAHEAALADGESTAWQAGAEPVVGIVATRPEGYEGDLSPLDLTDRLAADGSFAWTCEGGPRVVRVFVQRLESHPARAVSTGGRKDTTHSLPDYLRREATERFLEVTHEQYAKRLAPYFGTTLKGFFGDEPSLPQPAWTDRFLERFRELKGYDLRPHLGVLAGARDPDADGVRYDYFEVLASLWRSEFYQPQTDWCAAHGMTYTAHLCGEDDMMGLIQGLDADFFASEAGIAEPGVDAIWRQIFPGCTNDFPKLAGSAANVWGKPRAMTESFAVYGTGTTYSQMKYATDYQLVRGIDDFFLMEWCYSVEGWRRLMHPPDLSPDSTLYPYLGEYCDYVGRGSLIASEGTPIAPVAVYYPTRAGWLGDAAAIASAERIARGLLEAQVGFEWVDDNALAECCEIVPGGMRNRSGSVHTVLVVPQCGIIGPEAADRLLEFARAGGTVVFAGRTPQRVGGRVALASPLPQELVRMAVSATAVREGPRLDPADEAGTIPLGEGTFRQATDEADAVALARAACTGLPTTGEPCLSLRLTGSRVGEAEVWLASNEGDAPLATTLRLAPSLAAEEWDLETGTAQPAAAAAEEGGTFVALELPPGGARVLVVGPGEQAPATPHGAFDALAAAGDTWQWTFVDADGATHVGPLAPWSDVGRPEYSGTVLYEATVDIASVPPGRVVLDLGRVRYMAEATVNGQPAGRRIWAPYALDATGLIHEGANTLAVRVTNTPANRFFARPEDRQRAQDAGWFEGTYVGTYERFEADSLSSGLLGPVRLLVER